MNLHFLLSLLFYTLIKLKCLSRNLILLNVLSNSACSMVPITKQKHLKPFTVVILMTFTCSTYHALNSIQYVCTTVPYFLFTRYFRFFSCFFFFPLSVIPYLLPRLLIHIIETARSVSVSVKMKQMNVKTLVNLVSRICTSLSHLPKQVELGLRNDLQGIERAQSLNETQNQCIYINLGMKLDSNFQLSILRI